MESENSNEWVDVTVRLVTGSCAPETTLAEKVAFLLRSSSYSEGPAAIEAIETHMAWVFLTPRHAYKLKKPVRYAFLDFSTLEARRRDCEAEVRLNRRLARDVYLGTVPLTRQPDGALELRGRGNPVEWLVRMRRLPRERMLDHAIRAGTWRPEEIEGVAAKLVHFYIRSRPLPLTCERYRQRFRDDIEENRRELIGMQEQAVSPGQVERIACAQLAWINEHGTILDRRVETNRIIEAHGDLRPEHVVLTQPPVIIDCLEFNRAFRILDPLDELAFFAMECDRLGAADIGRIALRAYAQLAADAPPPGLVDFYESFRALLRAKIALWHLRDNHVTDRTRWRMNAAAYLELAEQRTRGFAGRSAAELLNPRTEERRP
jgi:aminoglycoside phosphotransferase family enzyme